jgi:FlaA1/EpsC-like NDP-sugar epimerase
MTTACYATINTLLHSVPGVIGMPHGMVFIAGLPVFDRLCGAALPPAPADRLLVSLAAGTRHAARRGRARAGDRRRAELAAGHLAVHPLGVFPPVQHRGIVDDDPRKQGMNVDGYRILGATADIPALIRKHDIGLVLYTISNINLEERQRILAVCSTTQVPVVPLPDLLTELLSQLTILQNVDTQSFPER